MSCGNKIIVENAKNAEEVKNVIVETARIERERVVDTVVNAAEATHRESMQEMRNISASQENIEKQTASIVRELGEIRRGMSNGSGLSQNPVAARTEMSSSRVNTGAAIRDFKGKVNDSVTKSVERGTDLG